GEPYERYNWDAPILVSHHDPKRLYFGTQRVWRSDNRGDSWTPISTDLTKDEERLALPIMGRQQSFDNPWDVYAMSTYNTITSLSESISNPNLLYAGTDDGIIQYTNNGGDNWTKMTVDKLPGSPSTAFVNDIKVDLHNDQVAYVALDNHKYGDYSPYLYKTTNGGEKWVSITKGIPDGTLVWRIVQDHINPNLLFLATEYGVYVSMNQGSEWHKFSTGLPTISVRDLAIQKRENDLVLATFGRSFYVLDDYSPLRDITSESLQQSAMLFKPRKALQYHQIRGGTSSQGGSFYPAENPKYGAMLTFYLKEGHMTLKSSRQKAEKDKKTADIPFPGWESLDAEKNESKPQLILVIEDEAGEVVDRIYAPHKKGVQRVNWDLKQPYISGADANAKGEKLNALRLDVEPGNYTVRLYQQIDGKITALAGPQTFEVERIRKNVLENPIADQRDEFIEKLVTLDKAIDIANHSFKKSSKHLKTLLKALSYVDSSQEDLSSKLHSLGELMNEIKRLMEGSSSKAEVGEKDDLTLSYRLH
ncbi:MAG: glycosyl hydrolase, partial [Bacteroidota bacterium]|nr:glycosyl hydrolase [Bacteroidota bacterium]